jgi:hypothetical protein
MQSGTYVRRLIAYELRWCSLDNHDATLVADVIVSEG